MLPENIIFIAVLINLVAYFFYLKSILRGETKPNLVSWSLWALAPFIAVFFQIKAGAGLSILPVFMAGFGPLLVIILSIFKRNAYWKVSSFDIICGTFSFIALLLYMFTHNLSISIIFAILSDGLAAVPTVSKSWKFPETETTYPYFAGFLGNILGLLIIKNWIFTIYSFGVYNIAVNAIIIFSIYRKKIFKSKLNS